MNFSLPCDSPQKFKVQSTLIYAIWRAGAAYANCDAMFEVRTAFVGEGAEAKIKGRSENGKNLGSMEAKIYGNRLIGFFPLPKNAPVDDYAYLEIKLSKQNLKGETNRIPIRPQIEVQQMKWSAQEVHRGDTVTLSVDFKSDIPNDTDATIIVYEYNARGNHDPVCKIPTTIQNKKIKLDWQFDYIYDTAEIPTHAELQPHNKSYAHPEYFFTVVLDEIRIGMNQESGKMKFKDDFSLTLKNEDGEPLANTQITLKMADGSQQSATTDATGTAKAVKIPPGPFTVELQGLEIMHPKDPE
jgi:hypothetical protein